MKRKLSIFLIILLIIITKSFSNNNLDTNNLKGNINYFINLFYLYNPYISKYDYLIKANTYNANSFLYSNSFEYGFSLSNIPYKYILPNKAEPMTSYTLMYSITNTNKNKINSNINYILKQNDIIQYDKSIYILESTYQIKKNLINIYFLNNKKEILNNILDEFLKIKELTSLDYTYNKSKLSDILIIDKEITSLNTEINSINLELNNNIQTIYSFIPLNDLENKINKILNKFYNNIDLNLIDNIINNYNPNNLDEIYNNPYLIKFQKEKELIYYEIYKESSAKLPDNKFSIEYSIRPHLDHMFMLKYSIMFENKNISINKIRALYEKINSINSEYTNQSLKFKIYYNYIILQLKDSKILLSNLTNEEKKQEKYIESLKLEYIYNKSKILEIYLAYKELLNIKLKRNELENKIFDFLVDLQYLKGVINYE